MDRERIFQVFFFGFLAVMAYLLYQLLEPFLYPILWAMLLSFLFHPAMVDAEKFVHRRSLAAMLITLATALVVIVPTLWFVVRLTQEAETLSASVSAAVGTGGLGNALKDWVTHLPLSDRISGLLERLNLSLEKDVAPMAVRMTSVASAYVAQHFAGLARNVLSLVWDYFLILVTLFYFLRDGDGYYESIRNLTPLHEEDKHAVFETLRTTLSSVVRGLMVTAAVQAVLIGGGLLIFGVPYWAFLSVLTVIFGIFPMGGTAAVWIPAALYLAYVHGWGPAVGLVVWCSVSVAVIDNFIKVWAMKQGTELPTIALFFGIAGGLYAYGPIGLFAGPAVLSVFMALLKAYRRTYGAAQRAAA